MIDFHQLIGPGGKEGAREKFEALITQLVGLQHKGVMRVEANPGDWGIDAFVGEIDGVVSVWQAKFFIGGVGKSQKEQIGESFDQVVAKVKEEGFTVDAWTLCIPVDLDAPTHQWWAKWKRAQEKKHKLRIELWDKSRLGRFILTPDAASLRAAYFPGVPGPAPFVPEVLPFPDDVEYEEMLFIKQLRAANVAEVESAKQQFFNAEALGREVADKRLPDQMRALDGEQADLHSMWEDRFNERTSANPEDELLPGLHASVMAAIEARQAAAPIEPLPMHLIHRKGVMHQVVDAGRAGWVRSFRQIAHDHA